MTARVSIVVPCYNEARSIQRLLDAVRRQEIPPGQLEVIVADGMSSDGTRDQIRAFAGEHPDFSIRMVDNSVRSIPAGLNRAIAVSQGEVVIRLDAHSVPAADYVARCLEALRTTHAANVGGRWQIEPGADTWMARSIAAAVADPLGAGDARYRTGGKAGPVDTVPFGAFRREWLERVGGYDESLLTNEDYELNWRLRRAGATIWFDPAIRCVYYARPDMAGLIRQYFRYGYWKARMAWRHPTSLRWRQVVPPAFVLGWLTLALASRVAPEAGWALLGAMAFYLLALAWRGVRVAWRDRRVPHLLGVPLALAAVHFSWGSGFLLGLLAGLPSRVRGGP